MIPGANFCDNGAAANTGAYGGCNANCTLGPRCGDGIVNGPEACDSPAGNGLLPGQCNPACSGAVLTRHIKMVTVTLDAVFTFSGVPTTGGIAGADTVCGAEFGANYRAFLAGPTRIATRTAFAGDGVNWVLSPYRQYVNLQELPIWTTDATPLLGVRNGAPTNLLNPIVPEDATFGTWTGMNPDYTTATSCNGWVTTSIVLPGVVGFGVNASDVRVGSGFPNNGGFSQCNAVKHLLCVEQ